MKESETKEKDLERALSEIKHASMVPSSKVNKRNLSLLQLSLPNHFLSNNTSLSKA